MKSFTSFLSGAILGALFSAAVVLLTTPKPGDSYRAEIKREVDTILEEGRRAAQSRRAEMEAQLADMRGETQGAAKKDDKAAN